MDAIDFIYSCFVTLIKVMIAGWLIMFALACWPIVVWAWRRVWRHCTYRL